MRPQKSAEAVRAGMTNQQRAEPVESSYSNLCCPEQMPLVRTLKPEVADGIREVKLGDL
jgi:hypothetical protein